MVTIMVIIIMVIIMVITIIIHHHQVETHSVVLEEGGVKLSLTVVDTPGFGDKVPLIHI